MQSFIRRFSISQKLSFLVGSMLIVIAIQVWALITATGALSSTRAFVGGEGLWSKAQKHAVHSLYRYVVTRDEDFYREYHKHLKVNLGDRQARLELSKPHYDYDLVEQGFIQGGNHPDDVPGFIRLVRRYYWISYVSQAVQLWALADDKIDELVKAGEELHQLVQTRQPESEIRASLRKIDLINNDLTHLENEFSGVLGEGSRWIERTLTLTLVGLIMTCGFLIWILTYLFSHSLQRSLRELTDVADLIGRGHLGEQAPVRSNDEIGKLASAFNRMSCELQNTLGQKKTAENASHVKTMFLANMSHEIRNPLGVILGMSEVLKDPSQRWEEKKGYIETIERSGRNLLRIVNDVLDISKVESGHLKVEQTWFELQAFLKETKGLLQLQSQKKKNQILIETIGPDPGEILTDRSRLEQILINLLGNALKFTEQGVVIVRSQYENGRLKIRVQDNGMGIASEFLPDLFQHFSRAEGNTVSSTEGSGLGLALSKRLANALGGDLVLEQTQLGKGSTFLLTIPMENRRITRLENRIVSDSTARAASTKQSERKILVVEDSHDNQVLLKLYLSRHGFQLEFANNGEEGVQKALSETPDLILRDIQMPGMDGYTATRTLRENGFEKPIIALTAHAMKEDRQACLEAGCDDYLTKPIDAALLVATLLNHLLLFDAEKGKGARRPPVVDAPINELF